MQKNGISNAVIRRLPKYYRQIEWLLDEGVERISSSELSMRMDISASLVRQDLNWFPGSGVQGHGYDVKNLYEEIGHMIGVHQSHNIIVVGAESLGQALATYSNFEKYGFIMTGMFDVNPRLVGLVCRGVEIRPLDHMEAFIRENDIQIAALTVPPKRAVELAARLYRAGVRAIWNFANADLELPDDMIVENVHLSESLMQLSFRLNASA